MCINRKGNAMSYVPSTVLTRVCNEQEGHERGVRTWTSVEIQSERWFQIETCEHTDDKPEVTSFFTANYKNVQRILFNLQKNTWTVLRLYCRMPLLSADGVIFESITKVFATEEGSRIFLLESGLMLHEHPSDEGLKITRSKIREVYSSAKR